MGARPATPALQRRPRGSGQKGAEFFQLPQRIAQYPAQPLGLVVPVWDLPADLPAEEWIGPATEFQTRLESALASTAPLTSDERRARAGLLSRQITLR